MRRVINKLSIFIPLFLAIAIFNFQIDPAHLFSSEKYEQSIAKLLSSGQAVSYTGENDDLLVEKFYIEFTQQKKDILVFGASQLMQLNSNFFPGQTFMNHSIPNSEINEYALLYYLYREKGFIPKTVILGLDSRTIGKTAGNEPYKSAPNDFIQMAGFLQFPINPLEKLILIMPRFDKLFQLVSPSYFQASLKNFIINFGKNAKTKTYTAADLESSSRNVRLADGSLEYNKSFRERSQDDVSASAKAYVNLGKESDFFYKGSKEKFEKFVKLLSSDHVNIIFFLIPYHPETYSSFSAKHIKFLKESENFYKNIAQKENIKIIGSFDPVHDGLDGNDFYDAVHIKAQGLAKILKN